MMTKIMYLTMEIAIDTSLPTYSGGLGVLAGDHIRAAADLGLPLVAVSLWYRSGYGLQRLDTKGNQHLARPQLAPERVLEDTGVRLSLNVGDADLSVRVFVRQVVSAVGGVVPVYFLDVEPGVSESWDVVNHALYGGGPDNRLHQEALLGLGGMALAQEMGWQDRVVHLNEGHTALAAWHIAAQDGVDVARSRCRFTTHTPVEAGHDTFDWSLVEDVLGQEAAEGLSEVVSTEKGRPRLLNMSHLAAALSSSVNGVSVCNAEVAPELFPERFLPKGIVAVTNGVHLETWCVEPMRALFDAHLPGWREDQEVLREAPLSLPNDALASARHQAKSDFVELVNARCMAGLDASLPLLGFARRMTGYKRANLVLRDIARLESIAERFGGLQIVFSGRAHPADGEGQSILRELVLAGQGSRWLRLAVLDGYSLR